MTDDANVMLNGFGTVVNSLQMRAKPYLPQFCGIIKWRLNNKNAKLRQQAADLIARIAIVMKVQQAPPFRNAAFLECFNLATLLPWLPSQLLSAVSYWWQAAEILDKQREGFAAMHMLV